MGIMEKLFGTKKSNEVDAYRIDDDGTMKKVSVNSIVEREKARQENERAVGIMDRGDYRSAIKVFNQVLEVVADDPDPMLYLNIAVCHAHLGEFKKSLSVLEEGMRRFPDNGRLRMNYDAIKQDAR